MPMTVLESDTVAKFCASAKQLLGDVQPKLESLRAIYDSAGGVKETLTQEEMDENAALSGLTKGQLDDAAFAMTGAVLTGIENGYAAIAQLAARFV
jgi:hypothetical protein